MSTVTEKQVYEYYRGKGLSHAAAAGITGNLAVESAGFSKSVIEGKRRGDKGTAYYVAQWRGGRKDNLHAYAKEKGKSPTNLETQLDFVLEEMDPKSQYKDSYAAKNRDKILGAKTPKAAANATMKYFERAHSSASINHVAKREKVANTISKFGDYADLAKEDKLATPAMRGAAAAEQAVKSVAQAQYGPRIGAPVPEPAAAAIDVPGSRGFTPADPFQPTGRRNQEPDSMVLDDARAVARAMYGPDYGFTAFAGQEPPSAMLAGSRLNHPVGNAVDGYLTHKGEPVKDSAKAKEFMQGWIAANPQGSVGFGKGYMTRAGYPDASNMHIQNNRGLAWGRGGRVANIDPALGRAIAASRLPGAQLPVNYAVQQGLVPSFRPQSRQIAPVSPQISPAAPKGPSRVQTPTADRKGAEQTFDKVGTLGLPPGSSAPTPSFRPGPDMRAPRQTPVSRPAGANAKAKSDAIFEEIMSARDNMRQDFSRSNALTMSRARGRNYDVGMQPHRDFPVNPYGNHSFDAKGNPMNYTGSSVSNTVEAPKAGKAITASFGQPAKRGLSDDDIARTLQTGRYDTKQFGITSRAETIRGRAESGYRDRYQDDIAAFNATAPKAQVAPSDPRGRDLDMSRQYGGSRGITQPAERVARAAGPAAPTLAQPAPSLAPNMPVNLAMNTPQAMHAQMAAQVPFSRNPQPQLAAPAKPAQKQPTLPPQQQPPKAAPPPVTPPRVAAPPKPPLQRRRVARPPAPVPSVKAAPNISVQPGTRQVGSYKEVQNYTGKDRVSYTAPDGSSLTRNPNSKSFERVNKFGAKTNTLANGQQAGGPGGDSETYLCTVAYEFGWIDADTLAKDGLAGHAAPDWLKRWYDSWAKDYADLCRRNSFLRSITMPLVTVWAKSMAKMFDVNHA